MSFSHSISAAFIGHWPVVEDAAKKEKLYPFAVLGKCGAR